MSSMLRAGSKCRASSANHAPRSLRLGANGAATVTSTKIKKKQHAQLNLHSNSDLIRKGLETYHKGKHLLLVSKYLCKQGQVPEGQEDFLWEYTFIKVNDDCKTGIIEFNQRYILDGVDHFINYPADDDQDTTIKKYKITGVEDDHELFNVHLHRVNKLVNDAKDRRRKEEEYRAVLKSDNVTNVIQKTEERHNGYNLLVNEFESCGPLEEHKTGRDVNQLSILNQVSLPGGNVRISISSLLC